jgi:hypothetical protein
VDLDSRSPRGGIGAKENAYRVAMGRVDAVAQTDELAWSPFQPATQQGPAVFRGGRARVELSFERRRRHPKGVSMRIAAWTGVLCSLLASLAHAAGDRTQGTYVCGGKLEVLTGGKPRGECLAVTNGVPSATTTPATLTLGTATVPAVTTVAVASCVDHGAYWTCPNPVFTDPSYCSGGPQGFEVYILKASLSHGGFTFSAGPPPPLTLVCSGNGGYGPQLPSCGPPPVEAFSTAGDCIGWNYGPTTADQRLFNACVRMARADYLGNGWSATRAGTHIQPASRPPPPDPCNCTDCESCLEAYWNDQGAVCIYHRRWQEVVTRVATLAGVKPPAAEEMMRATFPSTIQYKGQRFDCRRDTTPENALLWNRSRIHSCTGPTLNVAPCPKGAFDPDCRPPCPP